ncbi:MAG: ATP-binding protein [Candidatus Omnitrophota bacterium]
MIEDKFFGRKQYLDIIEKRIIGLLSGYRQNLAIVGDELVGKTSIIYEFLSKYYDNKVIFIYIQARPETLNSFAKRFIGVLLYNFLSNSGLELKEDLNFLIDKSAKFIPQTIEKIKLILNSLEKRKKNNILTELFSLSELINSETSKSSVVIFDEFNNLESLGIKNLYQEWSKLLMTQKNTMYIIVSSAKFKTRSILSKNLSLLFGNFEVFEVEPFDIKTSGYYLSQANEVLNLNNGLRDFIVHFSGGYPFYLKLIRDTLLKAVNPDLASVLQGLLFESSGILNQRFSNYLKRFLDSPSSQQYLSILYLVACGHNRLKDIAHIEHKTQKELNQKINSLLEIDAITRLGDFLKINDRVFSFWLKFVYQEKLNSLTFDAKNQKAIFRGYIESGINEFLVASGMPLMERITEVLRQFSDDTIQIEQKRMRLNHFREIKPLEFNNKNLKEGLIGRSHDSLWIMAFKNDSLTEDYVADFSKECKRYRNKTQRKIIIALKDIDANARLRALEERILTWDLNNLNQILDLFSKPRVIV